MRPVNALAVEPSQSYTYIPLIPRSIHPSIRSLTVPEVPTILIEGGAAYPGLEGGRRLIQFEVALLRLQLQVRGACVRSSRPHSIIKRQTPND